MTSDMLRTRKVYNIRSLNYYYFDNQVSKSLYNSIFLALILKIYLFPHIFKVHPFCFAVRDLECCWRHGSTCWACLSSLFGCLCWQVFMFSPLFLTLKPMLSSHRLIYLLTKGIKDDVMLLFFLVQVRIL